MYLTLSGHARDCIRDLTPGQIGTDTGLKAIVDKLDKTFFKDKETQTFIAFETFYSYRRSSGENITDFLVHFEYLQHKMEKQSIHLPEGVLTILLLKAANISTENEKLARATCASMTYDNMKACITKIFGDPSSENSESNIPSVKAEPVFKTEHEEVFTLTDVVAGKIMVEVGVEGVEDMEIVPIDPTMQMPTMEVVVKILRPSGLILLVEVEK